MPARSKKNKIAIFGGSFNPIHNGHIKMAEIALSKLNLDIVLFIPTGTPPHKKSQDLLPAQLRIDLLQESIKKNKRFKISNIEINKTPPSYTYETIKELQKRKIINKNTELYFIIGKDQFDKLHKWYEIEKLCKLLTFIVFPRKSILKTKPNIENLKYIVLKTRLINISSREIRKRAKSNRNISKLVPFKCFNS